MAKRTDQAAELDFDPGTVEGDDAVPVEMTVVKGVYSWMVPRAGRPGRYFHRTASAGETIVVTTAEARRGQALGFLVPSATRTAVAAEAGTDLDDVDDEGLWSDERIASARAEDLVAYVTQHPDEAERVLAIEIEQRGEGARKTVLQVTGGEAPTKPGSTAEVEPTPAPVPTT